MSTRTFTVDPAGKNRLRTAALAVLGAAVLGASGMAVPASATTAPGTGSADPASIPGRGARTAVTFDPSVVRSLMRLGVRIRPVDAQSRGTGDNLTIIFRVVSSRGGLIEHRGGIVLDPPRRPDLRLERPIVDTRRGMVSVSTGHGDRVAMLSVDMGSARPGDHHGDGPADHQGGTHGTMPAAGGGGTAIGPDHDDYQATLRLTSDGERLLDRALGTDRFRAGQRIGTAEFAEH